MSWVRTAGECHCVHGTRLASHGGARFCACLPTQAGTTAPPNQQFLHKLDVPKPRSRAAGLVDMLRRPSCTVRRPSSTTRRSICTMRRPILPSVPRANASAAPGFIRGRTCSKRFPRNCEQSSKAQLNDVREAPSFTEGQQRLRTLVAKYRTRSAGGLSMSGRRSGGQSQSPARSPSPPGDGADDELD